MPRFDSFLAVITLLPSILSTAIPLVSLAMPSQDPIPESSYMTQSTLDLMRRQNGNPQTAGDLYGFGLRVGAYLQIFGMLLSCVRTQKRSRSGILLLSSSLCLSLFLAWTILVARHSISPCEAWLILSLSAAYGAPRFSAMNETQCNKGGIATVLCLVSVVWQQVLYFWFFVTLYRELPPFGTSNRVWFFAPVNLHGWFRIFMLVVTCIECLLVPLAAAIYFDIALDRFVEWTGAKAYSDPGVTPKDVLTKSLVCVGRGAKYCGEIQIFHNFVEFGEVIISRICRETPEAQIEEADVPAALAATRKEIRKWRIVMTIWGFVVLILTIAGVEKIIEYNSLSPTSDLSQPGQNIPFILGIITVVVGASHAIKPALVTDTQCPQSPATPNETPFRRKFKVKDFLRSDMEIIDVTKEKAEGEVEAGQSPREIV